MGLIITLRSNKKFLYSFLFFAILLFIASLGSGIYQASPFSQKNIAKFQGNSLSEYAYTKKIQQIERYVDSNMSERHKHEQAIQEMLNEVQSKAICQNVGILVTKHMVENEIASYGLCTQEIIKKNNQTLYEQLENQEDKQKAFNEFMETEAGKRFLFSAKLKEQVKFFLYIKKAASLFSNTLAVKTALSIRHDQEIDLIYGSVNLDQIDLQSSEKEPKQEDLEKYFQKQHSSKEKFKNVAYIRFFVNSSTQEIQEVLDELEMLKKDFATTKDPEAFARKHSNIVKKDLRKIWKKDAIPLFLKNLEKNQISPIINIANNTWALYRVSKKENKKIEAIAITKKATRDEKKQHVQHKIEHLKRESEANTWAAMIKKTNYDVTNIKVTQAMANKIGSSSIKDQIAHLIFKKQLRKGDIFTICNNENKIYIIGRVGSKGYKNCLDDVKDDIKKKLIQERKIARMQAVLDEENKRNGTPEAFKKKLIEKLGYIDFKTKKGINITSTDINTIKSPENIAKLCLSQGDVYAFKHRTDIIIVKITGRKKTDEVSVKRKDQEPSVVAFEKIAERIQKNPLFQDRRYRYF